MTGVGAPWKGRGGEEKRARAGCGGGRTGGATSCRACKLLLTAACSAKCCWLVLCVRKCAVRKKQREAQEKRNGKKEEKKVGEISKHEKIWG
jgi:hypothetical protein